MSMIREGMSSPAPTFYRPSPQPHHPDFNMPMYPLSVVPTPPGILPGVLGGRLGNPHHHHPPPHVLPGGGGLYSMTDLPSPSSFHMSMVEASTPSNMSMRGGVPPLPLHAFRGGIGGGGDMTGIRDLNNYLPIQRIKIEGEPKRLFTVENRMTRETIVVLTSSSKVMFFLLKIKNDDEAKTPSEKFDFVKFHELSLQAYDLEAFVISQNCSITLIPFKLLYALSTRGSKTVFVYDQGDSSRVPDSLKLEDASEEDNENSNLVPLNHDYPVTHLAIDAEKEYLAAIQELGTVIVWDINSRTKQAVFHIPNQGIHISFHSSEPYQLLVIDAKGWARYFNVYRQCCFRSIHLVQSGVFSAEWSLSNPNIFAAGFAESFMIIDTCKVISNMNKCYEVPEQVINAIKINPMDDKVYATLSRLTGSIQLWRDNFGTHIWKHRNSHVNDIAWVHGYPYLLALGHQTLYIYDCSVS